MPGPGERSGSNDPRTESAVTIGVTAERVGGVLLLVSVALALLSLAGQVSKYYFGHDHLFGLVHQFNVSHEGNIPTWYSSFSLLACSVLLAIIGQVKRREHDPFSRHWTGIALLFLYVSIDEGAQIHEMMNTPLRTALGTHGLLYYPAALVGAVFAAIFGFVYLKFLLALPSRTRLLFIVSAVVYLGGALGVEAISARHAEIHGQQNMTYAAITTVEELGEMAGVAIFIYTLLSYMAEHMQPVLLRPRTGRKP